MASTKDLRVENLFSVKDYVCLVTGGGSGIGLMATQVLAANGKRFPICSMIIAKIQQEPRSISPVAVWKSLSRQQNLTTLPKGDRSFRKSFTFNWL